MTFTVGTGSRQGYGTAIVAGTGRKFPACRSIPMLLLGIGLWCFPWAPARAQVCGGDCSTDGTVTVDEIITCVNIALGNAPMTDCPAGDADGNGELLVDDLIVGINAALNGCASPGGGSIRVQLTGNLPTSESVKVLLDDGTERLLVVGQQLMFFVEPGAHKVQLAGLPENCQASGGNLWPADVIVGQTFEVLLDVNCSEAPVGPGDLMALLESAGTYPKGPPECRVSPCSDESEPSAPFQETAADGSVLSCTTQTVSAEQYPDDYATFDPNAEVIYPGSMLQGATLDQATPDPIVVHRAGGTFGINLLNASPGTYQSVLEVNQTSVVQAINNILADNTGVVPARFNYQSFEVQSMEQLALSLGVNVSTLTVDFQSNLSFSTAKKYNRFVVQFTQSFYTVSFDLPRSLEELFAPEVTAADLAHYVGTGNPASYISSVTYGRRFYLLIESTASATEMAASIKASYDSAVVNGSLEAGATYVKDLRDVNIKVFALGGDQSLAAAMFNGDPQALGAFLTHREDKIILTGLPLSYVVRNVLDNRIIAVKVATDYDVKTCSPVSGAFYSGFDNNAEGWTSYANGIYEPVFTPADTCADNYGGCITLSDLGGDSQNSDGQFRAPAAWRDEADWSHFDGGTLTYRMRLSCDSVCAEGIIPWANGVTIMSPSNAIYLDLPPGLIADMYKEGWQYVRINLDEAGTQFGQGETRRWQVETGGERCDATKEDITSVLSDVTDFRIRADYVAGKETTWLDEVALLAPPPPQEGCESTGGTVQNSACCQGVGDFPNTCSEGACGCAPESSEQVRTCNCGAGKCFDGTRCVVPAIPACVSNPPALVVMEKQTLSGRFDWTGTDEWITSAVDLDAASVAGSGWQYSATIFPAPYEITHWATAASSNMWWLTFNTDYWKLGKVAFADVSPHLIASTLAMNKHAGGNIQYEDGDVFVLLTDQGNLAKIKVLGHTDQDKGWPYEFHYRSLDLQYEVYSRPEVNP